MAYLTDPAPSTAAGCSSAAALTPKTLRWAVVSANNTPGDDEIIVDASGYVKLNTLCDGLDITQGVSIVTSMPSFEVTLSPTAANQGTMLEIAAPGSSVSLKRISADGGHLSGNRGIYVEAGDVRINRSLVRAFSQPTDHFGYGAAILVEVPQQGNASLHVEDSVIEKSFASLPNAHGGCIAGLSLGTAFVDLTNTVVRTCGANGKGGLIHLSGSIDSHIAHSVLYDGEAVEEGGALYAGLGSGHVLTMSNSTISSSRATDTLARGGGISTAGGTVSLEFVTVADNALPNAAQPEGTQVAFESSSLDISGAVFQGDFPVCFPSIAGATNSMATDASCSLFPVSSPLVGSLTYGFNTFYHVPLPGSLAIDGASTCPGSGDDQRHVPRGSTPCWIGSYEQ